MLSDQQSTATAVAKADTAARAGASAGAIAGASAGEGAVCAVDGGEKKQDGKGKGKGKSNVASGKGSSTRSGSNKSSADDKLRKEVDGMFAKATKAKTRCQGALQNTLSLLQFIESQEEWAWANHATTINDMKDARDNLEKKISNSAFLKDWAILDSSDLKKKFNYKELKESLDEVVQLDAHITALEEEVASLKAMHTSRTKRKIIKKREQKLQMQHKGANNLDTFEPRRI
jgi:uncharacterized small protein (DUF1192 family)